MGDNKLYSRLAHWYTTRIYDKIEFKSLMSSNNRILRIRLKITLLIRLMLLNNYRDAFLYFHTVVAVCPFFSRFSLFSPVVLHQNKWHANRL